MALTDSQLEELTRAYRGPWGDSHRLPDRLIIAVGHMVAEAEQRALRDAADEYPWRDAGGVTDAPGGAKHWLRARADELDTRVLPPGSTEATT